jgi:hypothetical protein
LTIQTTLQIIAKLTRRYPRAAGTLLVISTRSVKQKALGPPSQERPAADQLFYGIAI